MTFIKFLERYLKDGTEIADFAGDAVYDKDFPTNVKSWAALKGYLYSSGACDPAIEAAHQAWKYYKASLK